jgi:cytochrome P450 family 142 subfamily A polypeptide 1
VTSTTTPYVNLLDPEWYVDPFDAYRWLRDEDPVFWDPVQRIWGISRHADVLAVENDTARFSSLDGSRPKTDQRDDTSMINRDDPAHQRQRMVVARRFTPRGVRSHEDRVRDLVTVILDEASADGGCEAVEMIASRLPAMVICELLGYDASLWPKVREWSEVTMYQAGQTPADGSPADQSSASIDAIMEFAAETMAVIAARRTEPRDDLISVWAHTEVHGQPWDDGEILAEALLVLDGGAETTRAVIAGNLVELARRPEQRRALVDSPDLLGSTAVEEFIRWVTPISNMRRTALVDTELHGRSVKAGDELLLLYGSANRDERVFDEPDTYDVTRTQNHHVAFGFGTHFCLGASLARLELRVLFEELLARFPDWRLLDPEPRIVPATFTRGYGEVHIGF